jgi:integrase
MQGRCVSGAHIVVRQGKKGKRYIVRFRRGGRGFKLEHGGSFKTKREAMIRRDFIAGELAAGRDPRIGLAQLKNPPRIVTFGEWAERWVRSRHDVTERQRDEYRHPLRLILPRFEAMDPRTITPADVSEFVGELARRYAPSTVRTYYSPLAMILDFADVQPNPARHPSVKLPTRQREEPTPMTLAQFRAMLDKLPRKWHLFARLLEATGMRVGELTALTWGDVDSFESRLRVSRARTKGRTAGQRFVQVPGPLIDELADLLPMEDRAAGRPVFVGFSDQAFKQAMGRACKAAGLPHFHPHDLRHRRVSLWHGQGVPPRELAERTGHSRTSITLDVYSHVIDPRDDEWAVMDR